MVVIMRYVIRENENSGKVQTVDNERFKKVCMYYFPFAVLILLVFSNIVLKKQRITSARKLHEFLLNYRALIL